MIKRREIEIPEEGDRVERICWFGFGSCDDVIVQGGYRDCDGNFVNKVGINWNVEGTVYESIHVKPSWAARFSVLSIFGGPGAFASATTATAWTMYNQIRDCLEEEDLLDDTNVRSWTGIWQQLHCHIVYNLLGGGSTWDLEGFRPSNWVGYLNPTEECNWS